MHRTLRTLCAAIAMAVALTACGGKDKTSSSGTKDNSTVTADPPKSADEGMSVADAKAFLNENETNSGKEVTVTAYSWGYNEMMGGLLSLNLGDQKLEGFQQATFSCQFDQSQAGAVKAIAKDAKVTVTGKIGKGSGGVELTNCKLIR